MAGIGKKNDGIGIPWVLLEDGESFLSGLCGLTHGHKTERELGPLAEGGEPTRRLVATLLVFLEEGASFARAARRLRVHENTIGYRVRRAEELLGHRIADRRLELHVALQLISLGRPAAAREEDPAGG